MSYKIIVTPDAIQNIDDAIAYYKHKASIKVARNFIEDYRSAFKDIQKTIYFQIFFDNFRGKPLKRFPHIIFYTVDETLKTIVIKAVFHTSQNPNKYPV